VIECVAFYSHKLKNYNEKLEVHKI